MWICQSCETPNDETLDICKVCSGKRVEVPIQITSTIYSPTSSSLSPVKADKLPRLYTPGNIWWKWLLANEGAFLFIQLFSSVDFYITGFVLIISMSLLQWLVLKQFLPKTGSWVVFSPIATIFAIFALSVFSGLTNGWVGFILLGGIVGFVQWLIIRQHSSHAIGWILASAISWLLIFSTITVIPSNLPEWLKAIILACSYSIVTGWSLTHIFREKLL
jgi:hypothetical protein